MTIARFYVSTTALDSGRLALEGAEHHHASRVLRMRVGEKVVLLDGRGSVAAGTVEEIRSDCTWVTVESVARVMEERPRMHLFQAVPQGSRMDGVVHWSVELGAASLRPFISSRTAAARAPAARRLERWRRIALEASRVAGRPYLLKVEEIADWGKLLLSLAGMEAALYADETGGVRPEEALSADDPADLALVVGPEGGFSDGERNDLAGAGARAVTLGDNVLRAESAGMVLLAAARCRYGLL